MTYIKILLVISSLFLLTGCSTKTYQKKPRPQTQNIEANKVRVIIDRQSVFAGQACSHDIYDGKEYIGILGNGGNITWDRPEGTLKIKAIQKAGFCGTYSSKAYNLLAGNTYKFYTSMMFLRDGNRMRLVSNNTAPLNSANAQYHVRVQNNKVIHKDKIQNLEKDKKFDELKNYTEKYPKSVVFIENIDLRLNLIGPKDLKVGNIKKLLKNGKSEVIIISLIKRSKSPYKEFSIKEIEKLQEMGLSDNIISAMMDLTTELHKQEVQQRQVQQTKIINQANPNNQGSTLGNELTKEITKQGVKMLLDHLF